MSFKVLVKPGGQSFTVNQGQNVLDAALDAGVVLPYSCRNGTCSSCRGKVVSGSYSAGAAPERILEQSELNQGYTLLCQAVPSSDLVIEATEVYMADDIIIRKMPVRIMSMEKLSDDVIDLVLQLPSAQPFNFLPGQYLEFLFNDGTKRSYSMASDKLVDHKINLHLRYMENGVFTSRVFGHTDNPVKPRDIMRIEGPLGSFFLRPEIDKPIIFVASGTGFAPIKAIIENMVATDDKRPAQLYWGGRSLADLYLYELAASWEQKLENFKFIPVISDNIKDWQGKKGFVHQAVIDDHPDLSEYQVYSCGNPHMVDAARHDFVSLCGLSPDHFFADAFTTEADKIMG